MNLTVFSTITMWQNVKDWHLSRHSSVRLIVFNSAAASGNNLASSVYHMYVPTILLNYYH